MDHWTWMFAHLFRHGLFLVHCVDFIDEFNDACVESGQIHWRVDWFLLGLSFTLRFLLHYLRRVSRINWFSNLGFLHMPCILLIDNHIDFSLQLESIILEVLNSLKGSCEKRIIWAIIPCYLILLNFLKPLTRCHNLIDYLLDLHSSIQGQIDLFANLRILLCDFGQDAYDFVDLLNDLFENWVHYIYKDHRLTLSKDFRMSSIS